MKTRRSNFKLYLIGTVVLGLVGVGIWLAVVRFEGEKPTIDIDLFRAAIGPSQELKFSAGDQKSGLRKIWIGLVKDGREHVLLQKNISGGAGRVKPKTFSVKIDPAALGLSDGKALLRMVAWDYSWRDWGKGNRHYIEKNIVIDTKPPRIDVLSRAHNISQGGTGLVIYRLSESCQESGVLMGDRFFPGYSGHFKDESIFMAFAALGHDQKTTTKVAVKALDHAGNQARAGFPHYLKRRRFKKDTINISDRFLKWKMPEFAVDGEAGEPNPLLAKFLKVNGDLRRANYEQLVAVTARSAGEIYWEGSFARLPKAARKAGFAEQRTYRYKNKTIDRQVHLGTDLASIAQSKVPAANKGKVVLADSLGIYGKTVMIDHGFGLLSLYSHLSRIDVSLDQMVEKNEIIGRTGLTGMAGGDHLHFAVMVHHTFVNPVEWWDANWIMHNVTDKIKAVENELQ